MIVFYFKIKNLHYQLNQREEEKVGVVVIYYSGLIRKD